MALSMGSDGSPVSSIALKPHSEALVYAATGPVVKLFDLRMPGKKGAPHEQVVESRTITSGEISQMSVSPAGSHMAVVDESGQVSLWDLDAKVRQVQARHDVFASSLAWRYAHYPTPAPAPTEHASLTPGPGRAAPSLLRGAASSSQAGSTRACCTTAST